MKRESERRRHGQVMGERRRQAERGEEMGGALQSSRGQSICTHPIEGMLAGIPGAAMEASGSPGTMPAVEGRGRGGRQGRSCTSQGCCKTAGRGNSRRGIGGTEGGEQDDSGKI